MLLGVGSELGAGAEHSVCSTNVFRGGFQIYSLKNRYGSERDFGSATIDAIGNQANRPCRDLHHQESHRVAQAVASGD